MFKVIGTAKDRPTIEDNHLSERDAIAKADYLHAQGYAVEIVYPDMRIRPAPAIEGEFDDITEADEMELSARLEAEVE